MIPTHGCFDVYLQRTGSKATTTVSRDYHHGDFKNVNTLELNPNILNIIPTRTITYDYNDEGARTKEVNLARR